MDVPPQYRQEDLAGVQHAASRSSDHVPPPAQAEGPCARCGGPLPRRRSGRPRRGARYCSTRCRLGAVTDRRAAARADLLLALDELAGAGARIGRALKTLGLRPTKPRSHPRKEIP